MFMRANQFLLQQAERAVSSVAYKRKICHYCIVETKSCIISRTNMSLFCPILHATLPPTLSLWLCTTLFSKVFQIFDFVYFTKQFVLIYIGIEYFARCLFLLNADYQNGLEWMNLPVIKVTFDHVCICERHSP